MVLARGRVPCDVLFIGEAPGFSEDTLGRPFTGPAGHLLNNIIEEAWDTVLENPEEVSYTLTNLIACIPKDDLQRKITTPPEESVQACAPRLEEFVEMCNPSIIVMVGKESGRWIPKLFGYDSAEQFVEIIHPAAILRMNISQRSLARQRAVVTLIDALEELEDG